MPRLRLAIRKRKVGDECLFGIIKEAEDKYKKIIGLNQEKFHQSCFYFVIFSLDIFHSFLTHFY
jgi:hypothetical protein